MKKSSTTQKTREENRKELAESIVAILKNPETPAPLYNTIIDEVLAMVDTDTTENPAYIQSCIEAFHRREEKRKGGVR